MVQAYYPKPSRKLFLPFTYPIVFGGFVRVDMCNNLLDCYKYRRKVFYKEKRLEIGKILRMLCEWKKIKIVEAEVCPDHVHMLLEIPPKISVSSFMGYLKGKSSLMIYEKYPELKYKYRNREFWCKGYYVDTVGKNAKKIEEYIKRQLEEDQAGEQLTMGNF